MLIAIGGLPGTGKSTLAEAVGVTLGAPVIAKDVVEASLWRSGINAEAGSLQASHDLLATLADALLSQGRDVVLDAVFGAPGARTRLRDLAAAHGTPFLLVECVCADQEVHRSRIEGRVRDIEGWYELTWSDVQEVRGRYGTWDDDCLVVDALVPLLDNVAAVIAALER